MFWLLFQLPFAFIFFFVGLIWFGLGAVAFAASTETKERYSTLDGFIVLIIFWIIGAISFAIDIRWFIHIFKSLF